MNTSKKAFQYLLAMAAVCSMSSCQTFTNLFKKPSSDSSSNAVKKEVVLPQDREAIDVPMDPKTYSPEEFAKGVIKGDWAIEQVFGQPAVGEKAPFIKFVQDEGRIYGNNGCNTINGEYRYNPADSTLTFDNIAVTMMMCHKEGITDYLINQALGDTRTYTLVDTEEGYDMNLFDEQGREVMKLTHQNLDFLNGTWKVIDLNGQAVNIEGMKLVFDIDEHKFHGNTGCNVINGRLETDMDEPNTFSFESIAVTMMMCPTIEYQTTMLVALEEACRAKPINKQQVQLLNDAGNPVITLQRTSDK